MTFSLHQGGVVMSSQITHIHTHTHTHTHTHSHQDTPLRNILMINEMERKRFVNYYLFMCIL